jgi:YgiT-type zinc finger domain-containing protein
LILSFIGKCPVHVVVAQTPEKLCVVITAYNLIRLSGNLILELKKQKNRAMKCVICKNGTTKRGKVTVTLERKGSIVLIKNATAQVCNNCGHYYLSSAMTRKVLAKGEESLKKGVELEVLKMQSV